MSRDSKNVTFLQKFRVHACNVYKTNLYCAIIDAS